MRGGRTAILLAGAILALLTCDTAHAGEPLQEAEAAQQQSPPEPRAVQPLPPPGLFVLPRRYQAPPPETMEPQGCTYRENKLDLIV